MGVAFEDIRCDWRVSKKDSEFPNLDLRVKHSWCNVESIVLTQCKSTNTFVHPLFSNIVTSYLNQCAKNLKSLHLHHVDTQFPDWHYVLKTRVNSNTSDSSLKNLPNVPLHLEEICLHVPREFARILMSVLGNDDNCLQSTLSRISICIDAFWKTRYGNMIYQFLDYHLWISKGYGSLKCIQFVCRISSGQDFSFVLGKICHMCTFLFEGHSDKGTLPVMVLKLHAIIPKFESKIIGEQIAKSVAHWDSVLKILEKRFEEFMFCIKLTVGDAPYEQYLVDDIVQVFAQGLQLGSDDVDCLLDTSESLELPNGVWVGKLTFCKRKSGGKLLECGSWTTTCSFCYW